ncbi:MAG TPA: helical backbone metal receptor, partial [Nitrospirota bacterium]
MAGSRTAFTAAFLAVLMIAGAAGRGVCFPVKVADDRKKAIEIPEQPRRIISLAPTNTELLFALGLEKKIIGVTSYCDYPEAARRKEIVGGFADVDVEKIVALHPDVILAFGAMQLPAVEELERRGQRVFWIYPHTVADILDSFERIGMITGAVQEARQLRNALEKKIAG